MVLGNYVLRTNLNKYKAAIALGTSIHRLHFIQYALNQPYTSLSLQAK